ncbi:MAG: BACON domain-containing protein [Alistipes sp.]|nr:BACON domain-containing protein [Alistipes sp.]
MKTLKNFLMLALMPLMVLALAAGCKKSEGPVDDPQDPVGPNVTKDAVINLKSTEVSVGVSAGSAMLEYSITNEHADAKISVETDAEWISDFDTSVTNFIRFNYEANPTEAEREAMVTVKYLYAEDVTFVVSQAAPSNGTFTLENIDVTSDYFSITVDVIPTIKNQPYIIMSASPEYIEAYELESDEALFADDYAYFEYIGSYYGNTALEIMQIRAKMGDARVTVNSAVPGEKYIFYMYHFDPQSGSLTSKITRIEVTAGHPEIGEADFNFQYEINGPDVKTQVDPVGFEGDYYFDIMTAEELAAAETAGFTKEEYLVKWWSNIVANLITYEQMTTDQVLAENTCWGEDRNTWDYELMANSDYYIFAFQLEANSLCCSTPKYEKFTTGDAVMSDNELSVYATNITSRAATFSILTTVAEDPYSFSWATAEEWTSYGSTDEERVNNLLKQYVFDVYRGDKTLNVTDLEADTEYVLYAFGNHGGVATTAPAVVEFKTASDAPGEASISFKDLGYYDAQDLVYLPGWSFLESDSYVGKAIYPIELEITPANHGAYTFVIYNWGDRTDEYNDEQYMGGLLYELSEHGSLKANYTYSILDFNNRYVAVAIVVDANGQYSEMYKKEIYCTYDGVNTDIEAFANWWDAMQSGSSLSSVYSYNKPMQQKAQRSNVKASERAEIVRENKVVAEDVIPATRF